MEWQQWIPADSAACGIIAVAFAFLAFRWRHRLSASAPAAAFFLVLLTIPVLTGIARLHGPAADPDFLKAVTVEAYAMMLGMVLPLAVLLLVLERSRRQWEIRRFRDEIEDLRGWKNPAVAQRLRGLVRRLTQLGICDLDLSRCHLQGLNLSDMVLSKSVLVGADMAGANLSGCRLKGADLQGADLQGAVLRGADMRGAILWGANLRKAVLAEADLTGATLKEADLTGADLTGARLEGVKGLTKKQIDSVGKRMPKMPKKAF